MGNTSPQQEKNSRHQEPRIIIDLKGDTNHLNARDKSQNGVENPQNSRGLHEIFNNSFQGLGKSMSQQKSAKAKGQAKEVKNGQKGKPINSFRQNNGLDSSYNQNMGNKMPNANQQVSGRGQSEKLGQRPSGGFSNQALFQGFGNFLLEKSQAQMQINQASLMQHQPTHHASMIAIGQTRGFASQRKASVGNSSGPAGGLSTILGKTLLMDKSGLSKLTQKGQLTELITNAILKKYNFRLVATDLKTPILLAVYRREKPTIKKILKSVQESIEQQEFQYEVTIAFWLAMHLEYLDIAQYLISKVAILRKIVASVFKKKEEMKRISLVSRSNSALIDQKTVRDKRKSEPVSQALLRGMDLDGEVDMDALQNSKSKSPNGEDELGDNDEVGLTGLRINKSRLIDENRDSEGDLPDEKKMNPSEATERGNRSGSNNKKRISYMKQTTNRKKESDLDRIIPTEIQVNTEMADRAFENIKDISELIMVKMTMRNEFPTLMTNILKIILRKQETKLSQIIVAYYQTSITKEILRLAIQTSQYDFLYYMFGFGKNALYYPEERISRQLSFVKLFKTILKCLPEGQDFKEIVKEICEWKLQTNGGNFLQALLTFELDDLAILYMGTFGNNLNEDLLIYCLEQQNVKFLKNALKIKAFDKLLFREDAIVEKLLFYLNQGTRTIYILNILSLIDISVWKNRQIKDIMEIFVDFAESNYEKNQLILSYNPVLTIVLACEILIKIATIRKKFENESKRIVNQLLRLGEMIISKITDDKYYEKLITDQDFLERPVLRIITKNHFERLMDENDPKAETFMGKVWNGREANNCDGNIFGYSCLSNVVFRSFKRVLASNTRENGIIQIASNSFEPNFKVDYMIQHRYRSQGIYFYFFKELFCAMLMLVIFQAINYQYLTMITLVNNSVQDHEIEWDEETAEYEISQDYLQDEQQLITEMQSVGSFTYTIGIISYLFTIAQILQISLKIVFNNFATKKIPFDKWTIIDGTSALLNIVAVQVEGRATADYLMGGKVKDFMDYFMIIALAFAWVRFFMYFLVVRSMSKLLLTLYEMAEDTLSFFFIVSCFIMIMSSIFTTLYQDVNPERFGSLTTTVRTLFDAAMAVYDYNDMGGRSLSYSILMVFHVFFSNVLLLNYLIAILSTTYDNMKKSGIFKYKKNLYQYCERFLTCFEENAYGNLVLQPPPLSYLCLILLPFIRNKEKMLEKSKQFSIMMFWIENSYIFIGFALYELALIPFAYMKTLSNLMMHVDVGLGRKLVLIVFWLVSGVFIGVHLVYKDCCNLFFILTHYNGFHENDLYQLQREDKLDINTKIEVLNLARDGAIILFKTLKSHFRGETEADLNFNKKRQMTKRRNIASIKSSASAVANGLQQQNSRRQSVLTPNGKISIHQMISQKDIKEEVKLKEKGLLQPVNNESSNNKLQVPKPSLGSKQNSNLSISGGSSEMGESYYFSGDEESDLDDFVIEKEMFNLELDAGYNPNDQRCLYVVKKSSLIEDWKIRRKLQIEQKRAIQKIASRENGGPSSPNPNSSSFKNISKQSNPRAYSLLVPQEEQKLVSGSEKAEEDDESQLNKGFKRSMNQKYNGNKEHRKSKYIFLDSLVDKLHNSTKKKLDQTGFNRSVSNNNRPFIQQSQTQVQEKGSLKSVNDFDVYQNQSEIKAISKFFSNFVIVSESSMSEHIDIVMLLRALPNRITHENINQVSLFNFKIFQESLIAYQNLDLVNTFEYFDEKNRERVQSVKEKLNDQKSSLQQVRDIVKFVKRKMYNHDSLMKKDQDQSNQEGPLSASISLKKRVTSTSNPRFGSLILKPQSQNMNQSLLPTGYGNNQNAKFQNQFTKGSSLTPVPDKGQGFFNNSQQPNSPLIFDSSHQTPQSSKPHQAQ